MSASRERKKRQELLANGGVDRKAAQEAQRKAAERKSTILYSAIALLFLAVTVFLLVYNSGILVRKAKAVTIDGVTYAAEDVAFYYYEAEMSLYNTIVSQYGTSGPSMIGLDFSTSFKEQKAFNATEEDAQTWDEYFKEQAIETMRFVTAAKAAAKEAGYTMSDEDNAYVEQRVQEMKDAAVTNGTSYSKYINYVYSSLLPNGRMTKGCFESNLKDYALASSYASYYSDSLVYTEEEVTAVYDAAKENYDSVTYQLVSVDGAPKEETDADGNPIEATEEGKAAAWQAAQDTAQTILDFYNDGVDLETAAKAYDAASFSLIEKGTNGMLDYVQWCYEDGRMPGDATLITSESNSRCYVVVFLDRYRDDTKTVDVRHVLINAGNFPGVSSEEVTDEQIKAKAEELLASWDGTEEGFAQLARDNSQDGNASSGGLYTGVYEGRMVDTFNDWIFDSQRKSGDSGIVKTDYGYHLMYYVADNHPQWYLTAEDSLRTLDYSEWNDALLEDAGEATVHDKGMGYVGR